MIQQHSSFTAFKKDFYSRVNDFSIFNCGDFNLLKVVLDALKVNYTARGKINAPLFYPLPFYRLYRSLKRRNEKNDALHEKLTTHSKKKNLILDAGRVKKNEKGKFVSAYFHNFYNKLSDFVSVAEELPDQKYFYCDIVLNELYNAFQYDSLQKEELILRNDLLSSYKAIENAGIFSGNELRNIRVAINIFFNQFFIWNKTFKILSPQKCFFTCHYHKEGFVLALKRNNIKAIELQHGLITPEDIFYVFPDSIMKIRDKTLFADEIWVYGDYWKENLLMGSEYPREKIKSFGYYLYETSSAPLNIKNELQKQKNNKKVILITTQPFLSNAYIEYIKFLSKSIEEKKYEWIIWIKPHPSEDVKIYSAVSDLSHVQIINENLDYLFRYSDVHISIYSTTLYEACRYNIPNFTLYNENCSDYIDSIVKSGVASLLYPHQIPFEINPVNNPVNSSYFFANCRWEMLND